MASVKERGSAELLKQGAIRPEDLKRLLKILRSEEVELVHWFPKGIPNPEVLYGAVRARPDVVGQVVGNIIKAEGLRLRLDVFPYGIPFPDDVIIRFETHQGSLGG